MLRDPKVGPDRLRFKIQRVRLRYVRNYIYDGCSVRFKMTVVMFHLVLNDKSKYKPRRIMSSFLHFPDPSS